MREGLPMSAIYASLLAALVAQVKPVPSTPPNAGHDAKHQLPSVYELDSVWTNQDGKQAKLDALAGTPVVVAMIYTRCQSICPVTVEELKAMRRELPASLRQRTRFALFSFDSAGDSPARLKAFAQAHGLDHGWSLWTSGPEQVRELAAVLGYSYTRLPNGEYAHSNPIVVLDAQGAICSNVASPNNHPALLSAVAEAAGP
jgi:cytochrome oxidase Cu insertion factor (SCO1/SenC/PrrC family)